MKFIRFKLFLILIWFSPEMVNAQPALKIGLLKYGGGGDWYANLESSL